MSLLVHATHGQIDVGVARSIVRDRSGPPNGILVRPEDNGGHWATAASLVMLPQERRFLVAFGLGDVDRFNEFRLP